MAGFEFAYDLTGADPIIREFTVKDQAVISAGEVVSIDGTEIDAGASGDGVFAGVAVQTVDNTNDGLTCKVIINPMAVYRVTDANARNQNVALDLASGGMGLTTKSNDDLKVIRNSTATEPTEVVFNKHPLLAARQHRNIGGLSHGTT